MRDHAHPEETERYQSNRLEVPAERAGDGEATGVLKNCALLLREHMLVVGRMKQTPGRHSTEGVNMLSMSASDQRTCNDSALPTTCTEQNTVGMVHGLLPKAPLA